MILTCMAALDERDPDSAYTVAQILVSIGVAGSDRAPLVVLIDMAVYGLVIVMECDVHTHTHTHTLSAKIKKNIFPQL